MILMRRFGWGSSEVMIYWWDWNGEELRIEDVPEKERLGV